jgi:3-dehydroquinate synthase
VKVNKVKLPQNSYEILIGRDILVDVGNKLKKMGFKGPAILVTNPVVRGYYGDLLQDSLVSAGFKPVFLEVPDGEAYKSLERAGKLYTALSELQVERMTPMLSLGGGVIGDLAGFVAATYMRGVPLIHLPTTLLAQVDSSIGGKVAVNHGALKNNIGTFYQPRLVVSDILALKTLSREDLKNGLAEVIKYGIVRDSTLFELMEANVDDIGLLNLDLFEEIVFRCGSIKARIVEQDEKDLGLRNILNFGHTVGHGIETASGYKIAHGKAVAIGMVAAGMISQRMGFLPESELTRIKTMIERAGLSVRIPGQNVLSFLHAMQHDKKKAGGNLRFVLPRKIGEVFIHESVSPPLFESVLEDLS